MPIDGINILTPGAFIFFLLIICEGYYIVEILFGVNYPFRKVFKEYNNNLFDRILHYIIWGILGNIFFFLLNHFGKSLGSYANFLNDCGDAANSLKIEGINPTSLQFILFSNFYFVMFIIILGGISLNIRLVWFLGKTAGIKISKIEVHSESKPKKIGNKLKQKNPKK